MLANSAFLTATRYDCREACFALRYAPSESLCCSYPLL